MAARKLEAERGVGVERVVELEDGAAVGICSPEGRRRIARMFADGGEAGAEFDQS